MKTKTIIGIIGATVATGITYAVVKKMNEDSTECKDVKVDVMLKNKLTNDCVTIPTTVENVSVKGKTEDEIREYCREHVMDHNKSLHKDAESDEAATNLLMRIATVVDAINHPDNYEVIGIEKIKY